MIIKAGCTNKSMNTKCSTRNEVPVVYPDNSAREILCLYFHSYKLRLCLERCLRLCFRRPRPVPLACVHKLASAPPRIDHAGCHHSAKLVNMRSALRKPSNMIWTNERIRNGNCSVCHALRCMPLLRIAFESAGRILVLSSTDWP